MAGLTTRWRQQDDQFDWFSAYINERGLQTQWRVTTFVFTASLATIPVLLIGSPTGPDNPVTVAVSAAAAVCAGASGIFWLRRWPTRRQSMIFALVATAAIAATCLSQSNPYSALMGCTTFAVIGGFVAYFHTVTLVAVTLATALTCAGLATYRLVASTADIPLAISAFLIVLGLNVGVPFGIHSLAHTLRRDLRSSSNDPLTGLLNRRSFYHSAYELLMRHRDHAGHLIVMLIDLDNFKKLNDTRGHAAGDRALVAVGTVLREKCRDTAVIGRVGGEEFVIADSSGEPNPAAVAERLRQAIAATPFLITASIGTASTPLSATATVEYMDLIDDLIRTADTAMYDAKRDGGNRVSHRAELVPPDATADESGRDPVGRT